MKTKFYISLLACLLPVWGMAGDYPMTGTLRDLGFELHNSYVQIPQTQAYYDSVRTAWRQDIDHALELANRQALLLYTQEQHMTFNMAYVLERVSTEYAAFTQTQHPYDRDIRALDYQIETYGRLSESLRRLPEEADSLDNAPRDSCLMFATELLTAYCTCRADIAADSAYYMDARTRMEDNYAYARSRYEQLQQYFFREGQTPFVEIIRHFSSFREKLRSDFWKQYDLVLFTDSDMDINLDSDISGFGANLVLVVFFALVLIALAVFWGIAYLIVWLVYRFAKVRRLDKRQLPLLAILTGSIGFVLLSSGAMENVEYIQMGVDNVNTFLWLLMVFAASILLRIQPEQIRRSVLVYLPLFVVAFVIILARNTFLPDSMLVLILPPLMLLISVRQLVGCILQKGKVSPVDSRLGWASLAVYVITFVFAMAGYTFVGLLVFIWWYFQLAFVLTVVCLSELLNRFKAKWLDRRVEAMRARITYVTGGERESLLFGATWFYDLLREVAVPALTIVSVPMSAYLSLNIFDFNDLFTRYYTQPFVHLSGNDGADMLCVSVESIVYLVVLFLVLKYLNRAIHALWQYVRYSLFLRKNNRTAILANEINLSVGNSIISVLVWMFYIAIVFVTCKIPTGSLGLIAGGLSAGVGLALKDVINNFIYGIQLVGGRLRVGDWIECDGVRGKVTSINYQCVQVETLLGTETSFLNASLFGKNFNNLTRNNAYEKIIIPTRVAYGTDIRKVREVLQEAMKVLRKKDAYGREIVEPTYGINVTVDGMNDSFVQIGVKQYVLLPEQVPYYDRAREIIYDALNAAGIVIPFPQCDVHISDKQA